MRRFTGFALTILLFAAPAHTQPTRLSYVLSSAGSSVTAKVAYLAVSKKTATFKDMSGTLAFAPKTLNDITLDVAIDARTLSAGDKWSTDTLKGESFFFIEKYPSIQFRSNGLAMTGKLTGNVTGDLTTRGVTKPVTLAVTFSKAPSESDGKTPITVTGKTSIDRTKFGMNDYNAFVGKRVNIIITAQMVPQT
jgi:polyisoprenoid-binding protein YceI